MNHQQYREWIELGLFDELRTEERQALEEHLKSCGECSAEMETIQAFHRSIGRAKHFDVTDQLLMEARQQFRSAMRQEFTKVPLWHQITETVDALFAPPLKIALGGAFMLAVGFLGGYLVFRTPAPNGSRIAQSMSDATELSRGESQIANVKFVDADPSDGEIEFSFDAVTPVHVKGSPNDPGVQSVLVRALAHEDNPGTRLRAVSAITSPMVKIEFGRRDNEVKQALINSMKYDENPAVRKEALKALTRLPFDDEVK
ncbi:MAG: zf-HC2 domain-containing protein, partial [Bacteroidota bacterium]